MWIPTLFCYRLFLEAYTCACVLITKRPNQISNFINTHVHIHIIILIVSLTGCSLLFYSSSRRYDDKNLWVENPVFQCAPSFGWTASLCLLRRTRADPGEHAKFSNAFISRAFELGAPPAPIPGQRQAVACFERDQWCE